MSKLCLNPCRHRRFHATTCQEQEILEIYDLRENRQLLVKIFGEWWWSPIRGNEPKSRCGNSLTALLDVRVSEVIQSHDYGSSRDPERRLRSELPVVSFEDFCKQFQRHLNVSRLESNHGGRIIHVLTEVHP